MAVLGIAAVLATLALPSFGHMLARHRLKAAAENLAVDLAELRFEASRRGVPLHLHFVTGAQWCYALATVSGCDCRVAQSCQLKTIGAGSHPGVQLLEAQDVLFDAQPDSQIGSGSALLRGADGSQLRVGLTRLGRPKVCAPGAAAQGYPVC
jgi:type IV fimbrial biogenesis protein FimT